jgi:hypothetical protein
LKIKNYQTTFNEFNYKELLMKKMILTGMLLFLCGTIMQSQVKIGDKGAPAKGTLLDLNGSYKGGLLLPNVAIKDLEIIPTGFTERGGDDTAPELAGMIVWSTDPTNSGLYMWDGEKWQSLTCGGETLPCKGSAPAPTAIDVSANTFAKGEIFTVSCTAKEDGRTFFIWTTPAGLSITSGQGSKTINVSGASGTYNKNQFTVFAANSCGISATLKGEDEEIVVKAALSNGTSGKTNVEIKPGTSVELDAGTVTGGNCTSYSYQWQILNNGVWEDITGATGEKYTTPKLSSDTKYRRITTCGQESVISDEITVKILEVTDPDRVSSDTTNVCGGTPVTLSYEGGNGITFVWYSDSCGGTQVGTGNKLKVSPTKTTTYYGRWEGKNSHSDCKSVKIDVTELNPPTVKIGSDRGTSSYIHYDVTFTATHSSGVQCKWYVGNQLQSGETGSVFTKTWTKPGTYTVHCEVQRTGKCKETASSNTISIYIDSIMPRDCEGCRIRLKVEGAEINKYPFYSRVGNAICTAGNVNSNGFYGVTYRMTNSGLTNKQAWYGESQKYNFNGCTGNNSTDLGQRSKKN